ncbi:MAG: hypothetical protein JXA42_20940 [Anaerolineales bacterium]|nr:hypothetical protein [Anaerolineales bacterium]
MKKSRFPHLIACTSLLFLIQKCTPNAAAPMIHPSPSLEITVTAVIDSTAAPTQKAVEKSPSAPTGTPAESQSVLESLNFGQFTTTLLQDNEPTDQGCDLETDQPNPIIRVEVEITGAGGAGYDQDVENVEVYLLNEEGSLGENCYRGRLTFQPESNTHTMDVPFYDLEANKRANYVVMRRVNELEQIGTECSITLIQSPTPTIQQSQTPSLTTEPQPAPTETTTPTPTPVQVSTAIPVSTQESAEFTIQIVPRDNTNEFWAAQLEDAHYFELKIFNNDRCVTPAELLGKRIYPESHKWRRPHRGREQHLYL